jgi:hypothetical protein
MRLKPFRHSSDKEEAMDWAARRKQLIRRRTMIKGSILLLGLVIVCFAIQTYQTNEVERQAKALVNAREYEAAIALLDEHKSSPVLAHHLARLLTTNPRLKARNYPEAIELSKNIINSSYSADLKTQAVDTLACAYFANREEELAKKIAVENHLTERLQQFSLGRLCQDSIQNRAVASEK